MSSPYRSVPDSTSRSVWQRRIRWAKRVSNRHGLKLETVLACVVASTAVIWFITLVLGVGTESTIWLAFFCGSAAVVALGLAVLGALIVGNVALPLVRVETEGITIDRTRFRNRPLGSRVWRTAKSCCGAVAVLGSVSVLLLLAAAVVEQVLSPASTLERISDTHVELIFVSILTLPSIAFVLIASIGLEVIYRAVQLAIRKLENDG